METKSVDGLVQNQSSDHIEPHTLDESKNEINNQQEIKKEETEISPTKEDISRDVTH